MPLFPTKVAVAWLPESLRPPLEISGGTGCGFGKPDAPGRVLSLESRGSSRQFQISGPPGHDHPFYSCGVPHAPRIIDKVAAFRLIVRTIFLARGILFCGCEL